MGSGSPDPRGPQCAPQRRPARLPRRRRGQCLDGMPARDLSIFRGMRSFVAPSHTLTNSWPIRRSWRAFPRVGPARVQYKGGIGAGGDVRGCQGYGRRMRRRRPRSSAPGPASAERTDSGQEGVERAVAGRRAGSGRRQRSQQQQHDGPPQLCQTHGALGRAPAVAAGLIVLGGDMWRAPCVHAARGGIERGAREVGRPVSSAAKSPQKSAAGRRAG